MTQLTVEQIRSAFPALRRVHHDRAVAYFDAPGGTQVPEAVVEAMSAYLFQHNANTHWEYPTSHETDAIIASSREAAADFLHCSPSEIVFGANMTTLAFHLGRTLARTWKAGDEIVVTELDHHANVDPWKALVQERGVVVRSARMDPAKAQVDYDDLARIVGPRTRLVAIGGASNAVGTINDLARAGQIARQAGALFFVDAVHLAPHELIDVRQIGCDFLACSAYKFYGPHAGILFAREALLSELPFPKLAPSPEAGPERAEMGTQNHEGIAGIAAAIDFLASIGGEPEPPRLRISDSGADARPPLPIPADVVPSARRRRLEAAYRALHERGAMQVARMWEALSGMSHVRLYGPSPAQPRTPTIGFTVNDRSAEDVSRALAELGLFVSHGDFYAMTCIERLGVEALVRVGCACYTTDDEIERLIVAVEGLA